MPQRRTFRGGGGGGGGGGKRRGRSPYYRGVLTGKLDHVNVTFLGPYEPTIIRLCPYYRNGLLREGSNL